MAKGGFLYITITHFHLCIVGAWVVCSDKAPSVHSPSNNYAFWSPLSPAVDVSPLQQLWATRSPTVYCPHLRS